MYGLIEELYPICRSITGNGLRETLDRIGRRVPLEIHEVPTGTQAFDWTVPREWNIEEAFIEDADGNRLIDFADHTLHVVSYSVPVDETLHLGRAQAAPAYDARPSRLDPLPD